ncbi:MAG TPA: Ig-like domain-containing protein [Thermoleophilaceae bacterium]|nr:Ig-like domain-containing protein [Thermoleophilaceae bacterium]
MPSSRLSLAVALLTTSIAATSASPAAANVLQHRGTGFKADAPADFKVSFKSASGTYKIASDKGRGNVTYRRFRSRSSAAKLTKLLSQKNTRVAAERGVRASAAASKSTLKVRRVKSGLFAVTQVKGSARNLALLNRIARTAKGGRVYRLAVNGSATLVGLTYAEPTHGQVISGSAFRMRVVSNDPSQIRNIVFSRDGKPGSPQSVHIATETSAPYEAVLDTTKLANGGRILVAQATYHTGEVQTIARGVQISNSSTPPPTPPPAPTPTTGGTFPALPAGSVVRRTDDFENGIVGSSYTSNQCTANNNRTSTDAFGAGFGKTWEGWWDVGDAAVSNHASRCEQGQWGADGPGEYVYRYSFSVPSDSALGAGGGSAWQYRLQFHGSNPSTSPPIAAFTDKVADSSKFGLRFAAGDSSQYQTDSVVQLPKNAWTHLQIRVRWNGASSWAEFHVNGNPVTVRGGGYRKAFSMAVSQGMPSSVYAKYGIDAGSTTQRLHGHVARMQSYKVG